MRRVGTVATLCACLAWSVQADETQTGNAPALPDAGLPALTQQGDACTTCDARQAAKMRLRNAKKAIKEQNAEDTGS
ncbi:hypothetical protein OO012_01335 [Rhodobacteraceae bacterium KMM 6894]|nr:hypothetical protein [Rhodobacteraceae bacterium KMM 6894]